jgi:hypothetical protein
MDNWFRNSGVSPGVQRRVLSFRWSDPEPDDQSTPVDWRFVALIVATLFLNFPFWYVHGLDFPMFYSLPVYAFLVGVVALLITALFFLGPALAAQRAKRPLVDLMENSLGAIPASLLHIGCVLFLLLWIANLIAVPLGWLSFILRRGEVSATESGIIAVIALVFLFFTGLQSMRTNAKLALFTNKLGIAILVAALLRVHAGWLTALKGFPVSRVHSMDLELWHGLSVLAFYVAPLVFLAANFGCRHHDRKSVVLTGLIGVTLPLAGTLLLVGVINVATSRSPFYQPSLNPNVAMALWGHATRRALPGGMMVTAITIFGAMRLGVRALAESVSMRALGIGMRLVLLACFIGAITWTSLHQDFANLSTTFEWLATGLTVGGAVLTADFVTGKRRAEQVLRIDWIGVVALLAGLTTPFYLSRWMLNAAADPWWHPWLLPSYIVAFVFCLLGRTVQRISQ